ncbi:MAG: molecular chaperone TorD family protein [Chromatiaceae bacterium]|nr:molecular chaperone TorD family protein [Chromatiaceae bacterium]
MAQRDNSIQQQRRRAETYWFLASLFGQPIAGPVLARLASTAANSPEDKTDIGGELRQALTAVAESDLDDLSQRLAIEHARLFLGLRQGYAPPPPYESVWRESRILGDSTLAVATAYSEAGFEDTSPCGPCDHIASELRFLASLCNAEAEATANGETGEAVWARERQSDFLGAHLLKWVPHYCQELARQSREPLYAALARVTGAIIAGDVLAMDTSKVSSQRTGSSDRRPKRVAA